MTEVARGEPDPVRLRDGTPAWVWPLLPTDKDRLVAEFRRLSPESRRHRFLSPVTELSESMLHHLVDEVDGVNHIALVLFVEDGDAAEPIAIARCVRYASQEDAADVAVTVKDAWQGRGVATALLEVLMEQRPSGVTRLVTEVAEDNPASLAMLRKLGALRVTPTAPGILAVEVLLGAQDLPPDESTDITDDAHVLLAHPGRGWLRTRDLLCPWLAAPDLQGPPAATSEGSEGH